MNASGERVSRQVDELTAAFAGSELRELVGIGQNIDFFLDGGRESREGLVEIVHGEVHPRHYDQKAMRSWLHEADYLDGCLKTATLRTAEGSEAAESIAYELVGYRIARWATDHAMAEEQAGDYLAKYFVDHQRWPWQEEANALQPEDPPALDAAPDSTNHLGPVSIDLSSKVNQTLVQSPVIKDEQLGLAPKGVPGLTPPSRRGGSGRFITDHIVELGYASKARVEEAISEARKRGLTAEQVLLDEGVIDTDQLARAQAARHGVDHLDLNVFEVDFDAVSLVPTELANTCWAVPVAFLDEDTLLLAVGDPGNVIAIDKIEIETSRDARPAVASIEDIEAVISRGRSNE